MQIVPFTYKYLWILALLITYGSLYPFNFSPAPEGALARLFSEVQLFSSPGDLLGNIGLFMPLGLFGTITIASRSGMLVSLVKTTIFGLVLAVGLQVAQIWFPPRTPALSDAIWNMLGCGLGMALGSFILTHPRQLAGPLPLKRDAVTLLCAWILIEWLPLVPCLDFQLVKTQVNSLFAFGSISFGQLFERIAIILFFGELLSRVFKPRQSLILLPLLAAAVIAGKLFLVDSQASPSMLLGSVFGVIGWWTIYKLSLELRSTVVVVALISAYSILAMSPYTLRDEPSSFGWLPLMGLLEGSMLNNIRSLGHNLALFASVLLLLRAHGSKTTVASIGLAFWVMIMELMQIFIATRSASITEPLLVLLLGQFLCILLPVPKNDITMTDAIARPIVTYPVDLQEKPSFSTTLRTPTFFLLVWVALVVGSLKILLKLPMIPYNVKELFRGDGSIPALAVFSLALLWIGAGSVFLGRHLIRSRTPGLLFAPLTLAVSLISLMLLWSGVTSESIGDIAGAANRFWFVTNKNVWGDFWREVFLYLDAPVAIGFLETCIRYSALYAPLAACLGLIIYWRERGLQCFHGPSGKASMLVSAMLFLWLCKGIAFDWSSTDNLNELIAPDGEWGLGGGGYLYGLVFLLCLNATLVAEISINNIRKFAATVLFSLTAIPMSWWLINRGLNQAVEKYGAVFSGVQFLLGPDRNHLLSQDALQLRWCVVYIAGVLVMSTGLQFGKTMFSFPNQSKPKQISMRLSRQGLFTRKA